MDPRRKGPGKRVLPPGADQSPQRRLRTTDPPDPRVLQATQALDNMSLVATSPGPGQSQILPGPPERPRGNIPNIHSGRGSYPRGPAPLAPDYGSFAYTPGQNPYQSRPPLGPTILPDLLSAAELRTLWDAAGTNPQTNFHHIKRDFFQNRYDLTPEMLEEACWTEEEDAMLRDTGITPTSSPVDLEYVAALLKGLKEIDPNSSFFRLRSNATYRIRIAYLDTIRYGRQNTGNPPAGAPPPPMVQPALWAPDTYTAGSGSASPGPVGGSLWPAQHYGVPPPMPGAIFDQQWQPGYTPSVGGPSFSTDQYECRDPQDYLDDEPEGNFGPYVSPGRFLGGNSSGGSDPRASPLPSPGSQSGDTLGRLEHGGDRAGHGGFGGVPIGGNAPLTDEILEDFKKKFRPGLWWKRMKTIDGRPYSYEYFHKVKNALREKEEKEREEKGMMPEYRQRGSGLTTEMLEDIKVLLAQGWSQADVRRQEQYQVYGHRFISYALIRTGWESWTNEEDLALLAMQDDPEYRNNWAKIRATDTFRGKRIEKELEARWTSQLRDERSRGRQYFEFTPADDLYIMLAVAQRSPQYQEMTERRFPLVDIRGLRNRSKFIGAMWGQNDDDFLRAEVNSVPAGTAVNWDSIAAKYGERYGKLRPRRGAVVKRRWEWLTTGEVKDIDEMMREIPH